MALTISLLCALVALYGVASASRSAVTQLAAPVLGQSVNLTPIGGTVALTTPGGSRQTLTAPLQVPVGTVVDTVHGQVELTAADTAGNSPYSGRFSEGVFEVEQGASGDGSTQIVLQGVCTKARTASVDRREPGRDDPAGPLLGKPTAKVRRYLQITADGKFEIIAANARVYENGAASWVVDDNCNGTTSVVGRAGMVTTRTSALLPKSALGPGETAVSRCSPNHKPRYCQLVFSDPSSNLGIWYLLLTHTDAQQFGLCLLRHGREVRCETYPLRPHADGVAATVVSCTLDRLPRGTYASRFTVAGQQIGIPLPFTTHHVRDPFGPQPARCYSKSS